MVEAGKIEIIEGKDTYSINFYDHVGIKEWNEAVSKYQSFIMAMKKGYVFINFENCSSCVSIAIASLFLTTIRNSCIETTVWISSQGPDGEPTMFNMFSAMRIGELCKENSIKIILDGEEVFEYEKIDSTVEKFIPLKIVDINSYSVKEFVDGLFEQSTLINERDFESSIKIKNILHETISNVHEHAYQDEEKAFVAVYVGCCKGLASGEDWNLQRVLKIHYDNRNMEYYQQVKSYYEIIVLDEGVGLASTLNIRNSEGRITKYPLSYSMEKTFLSGLRGNNNKGYKSFYSGLNYIYKLLSENGDYVFGREGEEFVELRASSVSPVTRRVYQSSSVYQGVAWIFHVAKEKTNRDGWYSVSGPFVEGKNERVVEETKFAEELHGKIRSEVKIIDERDHFKNVKNEFILSDCSSAKGVIWFTDVIRTKNDLLNTISQKSDLFSKSCNVLIVADVLESELSTFFCALDKGIFREDFLCEKIIVVSQHLRVQVFVKSGSKFYYDKAAARYYWNSKGTNLFDSLSCYYNHVVKYDSSVFWSRVLKKKSRDYLIVRGNIYWEGSKLSYYLNMEMILGDRELYGMIRHSLRRFAGLFEGRCIYKSTDVVMEKLCIELNYDTSDYEHIIYVGSVFVTGRTEEMVKTRPGDLKMNIFVNYYDNPGRKNDINRLLIWPEKELLDKTIHTQESNFERRGDTPSLRRIDGLTEVDRFKNQKAQFVRHYDDTMQDIRELYGGFVRLGHFNYHNNHDIFSINQREIIKTSAYEKRGLFKHFFEEFMISVGGEYKEQVVDEWKSQIKTLDCSDGLFIYRMHYYTNYLFELVDGCFKDSNCGIWENVLPLESFEKKSEQMPLMISDITLFHLASLIKEKYIANNGCIITLFDTMNVTGRTMRDMRYIVERAIMIAEAEVLKEKKRFERGSCKIIQESLFDLQTRRYNEDAIKSFYHFDLPRLGSKEKCILCTLIESCRNSKKWIDSDLGKKRIDAWIDCWKAVSPIYQVESKGALDKHYASNFDGIKCSFPVFAMQLVEIAYIINNRNYLYEACIRNDKLSPEEKMILLGIQIILFPQNDSYKRYNEVYLELFDQMNKVETASAATAFAAMVGIQANENTVKNAFTERLSKYDHLANEDIRIMIAILCGQFDELRNSSFFEEVSDMLAEKQNADINLLKILHSQLYNDYGDAHSTRFGQITKTFGDYKKLVNYCFLVCHSLEKLHSIIGTLNPLLIRSKESSDIEKFTQQSERKTILSIIEQSEKKIEEIRKAVISSQRCALIKNERDIVNKEIVEPLRSFHRNLFIPYGKNSNKGIGKDIEDELLRIMGDSSMNSFMVLPSTDLRRNIGGKQVDGNRVFVYYDKDNDRELKFFLEINPFPEIEKSIKEVWYLWNQYIIDEIYYLFGDIRHSINLVSHRTYDDLSLIARIKANENYLELCFESYSKMSAEDIRTRVSTKHRYQREELEKFGVSISYSNDDKNENGYHLKTLVVIPAIGGGKNV